MLRSFVRRGWERHALDRLPAHLRPRPDETLDLVAFRLCMLQAAKGYRMNTDSVALAFFMSQQWKSTHPNPPTHGVDLGCGNGVVGLLGAFHWKDAAFTLVEKQPLMYDRATRNCELNGVQHRCRTVLGDVALLPPVTPGADVVVSNPPYWQHGQGAPPLLPERRDATFESTAGAREFLSYARRSVQPNGSVFIVHDLRELDRVVQCAEQAGLEIVTLQRVQHRSDTIVRRVLLHFAPHMPERPRRATAPELPPLVLCPDGGTGYRDEIVAFFDTMDIPTTPAGLLVKEWRDARAQDG